MINLIIQLIVQLILFLYDSKDTIPQTGKNAETMRNISIKQDIGTDDSLNIYLIRQRWHTGILFDLQKVDTLVWVEIKHVKDYRYADVGWGDEEFYQYPGFDAGLAVKALFYPTPSTLRIEVFNMDLKRYAELSEYALMISVTREQFNVICRHVSETFFKDSSGNIDLLSQQYSGRIRFYKAEGKYHLFNTCNTWIARGLLNAGFDINPSEIIFTEDLFKEVSRFGRIIED